MLPFILVLSFFGTMVYAVPSAHIVVFVSPGGWATTVSDIMTPTRYWRNMFPSRNLPFNVTIEMIDANPINTFDLTKFVAISQPIIKARLTNMSLPKATVIVGPDFAAGKKAGGNIPTYLSYKAPHILPSSYPDASLPVQPAAIGGGPKGLTFYPYGAVPLISKSMLYAYADKGVKTIAAVNLKDYAATFNYDSCYKNLPLAISLGMTVVYNHTIPIANSTTGALFDGPTLQTLVNAEIDHLKVIQPDLLLWCDNQGATNPTLIPYILPLPLMKAKNYLPKAISVLSAVDNSLLIPYQDLMDFVVAPMLISPKLYGNDVTEGEQPFANMFRPPNPVPFTVASQVNEGSGAPNHPSSVQLYYNWYMQQINTTDPLAMKLGAFGTIASIDMIESALYRTSQAMKIRGVTTGVMDGAEVFEAMKLSSLTTPLGRVSFDVNRVNTNTVGLMMQNRPGWHQNLADIIAPLEKATAVLVYPIPTWEERIYKWSLMKPQFISVTVAIAAVCTVIVLILAITITVHRNETDVKMLRYSHVMVMLAACICCMWTLVFVWQDDMNQTQCTSYLWAVCIPASFAIHLVNLKAYRLYTFLAAATIQAGKKKKTIGQDAVIIRTVLMTLVTAVILAIITGVDPPQSTRVINDPYRAKLDYYVCTSGNTTKGLFYLLVIGHIVASIVCIMPVRNGFEAFQDGSVMYQSFIMLYMMLLLTFVMHQLGISHPLIYLLRSVLLCLGVTFFCFRFLINRCLRHWISQESQEKIIIVMNHIKKAIPGLDSSAAMNSGNTGSDTMGSLMMKDDDDSPLFKVAAVKDDNLVEMDKVFDDPDRLALFREYAEKGLLVENVDFIQAVNEFIGKSEDHIVRWSINANQDMKNDAEGIFQQYMKVGSEGEVNISSKTREVFMSHLAQWSEKDALIMSTAAKFAIESDPKKRGEVFEASLREIKIMLYQNIWNKFRAGEMERGMGDDATDDPYESRRHSRAVTSSVIGGNNRKASTQPVMPMGSRKSSVAVGNGSQHGTPLHSTHPSSVAMGGNGSQHGTPLHSNHPSSVAMGGLNASNNGQIIENKEDTPHVSCKSVDSGMISSLFPPGTYPAGAQPAGTQPFGAQPAGAHNV